MAEKHYGYNCPECNFDFVITDEYEVDGEQYPKISNEWATDAFESWTVNHKCPNCKIEVAYSDGT